MAQESPGAGGINAKSWKSKCQRSKIGPKNVKKWSNRVLVGRFGPRVCQNASHGFWEAYGTPPGAQNGHKKFKNSEKLENPKIPENSLFSCPIFPSGQLGGVDFSQNHYRKTQGLSDDPIETRSKILCLFLTFPTLPARMRGSFQKNQTRWLNKRSKFQKEKLHPIIHIFRDPLKSRVLAGRG